jgi:hypothetical protein
VNGADSGKHKDIGSRSGQKCVPNGFQHKRKSSIADFEQFWTRVVNKFKSMHRLRNCLMVRPKDRHLRNSASSQVLLPRFLILMSCLVLAGIVDTDFEMKMKALH